MTPQERQVWRMTFAAAVANGKANPIELANTSIQYLRAELYGPTRSVGKQTFNAMARIAMNVGDARR